MSTKHTIEVISAGSPLCEETIQLVNRNACLSCKTFKYDIKNPDVSNRAKSLGIRSIPAIVIDGKLTEYCADRGPDVAALQTAGLGKSL